MQRQCLHTHVAGWDTDAVPCAGFYIIPRSPTEVYYDVSTEAVEAQLYNWFYCCNTTSNANCPTGAATCGNWPTAGAPTCTGTAPQTAC
jgi:hypothetical protein